MSTAVNKRFPTTQHLVDNGLLTAEELAHYARMETKHGAWSFFIFFRWCWTRVARAHTAGFVPGAFARNVLDNVRIDVRVESGAGAEHVPQADRVAGVLRLDPRAARVRAGGEPGRARLLRHVPVRPAVSQRAQGLRAGARRSCCN